jgi:hypothetical protein
MKSLALLIGVVFSFAVAAETKTVTWVNATQNTDGTTIAASGTGSLVRTVVEYGTRNGTAFGTKQGEISVAAPATTLQLNLVVIQQYALRAFHCNTHAGTTFVANGTGCSDFSNVALTDVLPPRPRAPTGLATTVAAAPTAWAITVTRDAIVALEVGTVPPDIECGDQYVLPLNTNVLTIVPVNRVALFDGAEPEAVFAECVG